MGNLNNYCIHQSTIFSFYIAYVNITIATNPWVVHLVHFKNNARHNIGRIEVTKLDNPIKSKVDRYKIWAIAFW